MSVPRKPPKSRFRKNQINPVDLNTEHTNKHTNFQFIYLDRSSITNGWFVQINNYALT